MAATIIALQPRGAGGVNGAAQMEGMLQVPFDHLPMVAVNPASEPLSLSIWGSIPLM